MTLKKGTGIAEASDNRVHKYQLYKSLSKAYETLGDYSTALTYHKKFSKESENALNIEKERAINDLNRKYEQEKYEREIQQHNIEIKKKNRDLTIAIVFLIAAIGLSGVILSLYRKKTGCTCGLSNSTRRNSEGRHAAQRTRNHLMKRFSKKWRGLSKMRENTWTTGSQGTGLRK